MSVLRVSFGGSSPPFPGLTSFDVVIGIFKFFDETLLQLQFTSYVIMQ